jgi:hypothetical protein
MTSSDPSLLREVERILFAELETAMAVFAEAVNNSNPWAERDAACEAAIVEMRRLGAFLRTGEIPEDLEERLSGFSAF